MIYEALTCSMNDRAKYLYGHIASSAVGCLHSSDCDGKLRTTVAVILQQLSLRLMLYSRHKIYDFEINTLPSCH